MTNMTNDQLIGELINQIQLLRSEVNELRVSLAMAKHPELSAQYPDVAQQIAQREQSSISSLNTKMEAERMFK